MLSTDSRLKKKWPKTYIVMVLSTQIDCVDIHTTIIRPIIGQCHNELDASCRRTINDPVELRYINSGLAVLPPLKHRFVRSRLTRAILWEAIRVMGDILIIESPCPEDAEACIIGDIQAGFDIILILFIIRCQREAIGHTRGRGHHLTPSNGK